MTAVFDSSIYVDKGSADGVAQGDIVRIFVRNDRVIEATVRSLSRHNARCVANVETSSISVGTLGVVIFATPATQSLSGDARQDPPVTGNPGATAIAPVLFQTERAAGAVVRVSVRVTAASGASVYLNKGRAAGIEPGDEVVLYPPGSGIINLLVLSVSRNSSRCSSTVGQRINIDTRGEVLIPSDRLADRSDSTSAPEHDAPQPSPEHPPWTHPIDNWDASQPLLAPAYSQRREERASEIHGRLFGQYLHTWNRNAGDNQYSLGRMGAAIRYDNPFRYGGTLRMNGEFNRRGVFLGDDDDQIANPGWFSRISYRWGGTEDQPFAVEVGRFLPEEFPAFGVLDGAVLVYRTQNGNQIAVSAGFLPEPFPNLVTRDDVQIGVFYRWIADEEETLTSGIGLQKTWHRGTPDRDLVVHTVDYNPNDHFSIHSFVWGDIYDRHDTLKSTPLEVTEMVLQPMLRLDPGHGVGLHMSYVRWPQLLRREYSPYLDTQITNGRVFRYGVFTWQQLSAHVRVDVRVDKWNDQRTDNGTSWEGRVSLRDLIYSNGEVSLAIFGTNGLYSTGPGGRISVARQFPWCYGSISYELADYDLFRNSDQLLPGAGPTGIFQQYLRTNIDFTFGNDKSVSIFGDYRFGQSQDALQIGVFVQKRL